MTRTFKLEATRFFIPMLAVALAQMGHSQIAYPEMTDSGFAQLQAMRDTLRKACPSPDCLLVFLGRSNSLISAYLEARGDLNQVSLPVTNIRSLKPNEIDRAEKNWSDQVLEPLLEPALEGRTNIVVVDYVNSGGSVVTGARWIQKFARRQSERSVAIYRYGDYVSRAHQKELQELGISETIMAGGSSRFAGSLSYIAKEGISEKLAAYGEWDPLAETNPPKIDRTQRRSYDYLDAQGVQPYTHFASYDQLVDLFKLENPRTRMPVVKPNCYAFLGDML